VASGCFRFDRFTLDPANRQLRCDGAPVDLNARYLDALALLVRDQGKLISKDRFLEEVWQGVPVTDEALTQCIKTLRKQLGDDAGSPRFIETVPKHGYRFIAPVTWVEDGTEPTPGAPPQLAANQWREALTLGGGGTIGGGLAGAIGGLIYSFFVSSPDPQTGAASMLLVLVAITTLIGLLGGAGVAFGIAAAHFTPGRFAQWSIVGGALGGLLVGGVVKTIGVDTLSLMFGQSLGEITGAPEGALLGGAVGLGAWLASRGTRAPSLRRSIAAAGAAGAAAGVVIHLLGGRLMASSLDLFAERFPASRLRLDRLGALLGESDFGPTTAMVMGGLEGLLFGACVAGAMILARRRLTAPNAAPPYAGGGESLRSRP
jgi:DNA-binding winged helix-turn-helix (wHTH) protein